MKNRTKVIDRLRRDSRDLTFRMPFERGEPRQTMIARRTAAPLRAMRLAGASASQVTLLPRFA